MHPITLVRRLKAGWTLEDALHKPSQNAAMNLAGQRFGRLTAIEFAGHKQVGATRKVTKWRCRCDCGKFAIVTTLSLRQGFTKSCGCLRDEGPGRVTHGASRKGKMTREYNAWRAMKDRCSRQTCTQFPQYGGRGISVCDRWKQSFQAFLEDMGPCPTDYEIDRINNDGDYKPDNCRWATRLEQMRNVRVNALRGIDNEHISWSQAADVLAIPWWTLRRRLLANA